MYNFVHCTVHQVCNKHFVREFFLNTAHQFFLSDRLWERGGVNIFFFTYSVSRFIYLLRVKKYLGETPTNKKLWDQSVTL